MSPNEIFAVASKRETALSRLLMAYIGTGLVFMLLPGKFLGVWNLISISSHKAAEAISPAWIQAHGQAQVFGWIGSFILGIGCFARVTSELLAYRYLATRMEVPSSVSRGRWENGVLLPSSDRIRHLAGDSGLTRSHGDWVSAGLRPRGFHRHGFDYNPAISNKGDGRNGMKLRFDSATGHILW